MIDAFKTKLNQTIDPRNISVAHRLANPPTTSHAGTHKIIVKLCRRDLKTDLTGAAKTMKPTNFCISESLTPRNKTVSYLMRRTCRKLISWSTAVSGVDYIWVKPHNTNGPGTRNIRHNISTHTALMRATLCEAKRRLRREAPSNLGVWK